MIYGDNLEILRNPYLFREESVDLIYLDPPFNSNENYNLLFKATSGTPSVAQSNVFEDTWKWDDSAITNDRRIQRLLRRQRTTTKQIHLHKREPITLTQRKRNPMRLMHHQADRAISLRNLQRLTNANWTASINATSPSRP